METKPRKWGVSRIFCFAGFKTRAPLCRKAEQFSPELINQIEPMNVLARCRQIHARISTGRRSRDAIGMWPLRRSDAALDLSLAHI